MWKNYNYVKPAKSNDYYKTIKSYPNSTVWILFGLNLHLFVIYFDGILFRKITIIKPAMKSKDLLQCPIKSWPNSTDYSVDLFLISFDGILFTIIKLAVWSKPIKSCPNSAAAWILNFVTNFDGILFHN